MTSPDNPSPEEFPRIVGYDENDNPILEDRHGNRFVQEPLLDFTGAPANIVSFTDDDLDEFLKAAIAEDQDLQWGAHVAGFDPATLPASGLPDDAPARTRHPSGIQRWTTSQVAAWLGTDEAAVEALCADAEMYCDEFTADDLRALLQDHLVDAGPFGLPDTAALANPMETVLVGIDVVAEALGVTAASVERLNHRSLERLGLPHLVVYRFGSEIGTRVDLTATRLQLDLAGPVLHQLATMPDGHHRLTEVLKIALDRRNP